MGLRIETNGGALTALRNLQSDRPRGIGVGDRIITAFGTGSGFAFLAQLRPELTPLRQTIESAQGARELISAADAGLEEISTRIADLRSAVLSGGPELREAIDSGLAAIDRIAVGILGGDLGFALENVSDELELVDVQGGEFRGGFPQAVNLNVTEPGRRATADGAIAEVQGEGGTLRLRGPAGSAEVEIPAGAARSVVVQAINAVESRTGVEATSDGLVRTTTFGSDALLELSGPLEGVTSGVFRGANVVAQVNGEPATGRGNTVVADTPELSAVVQVRPDVRGEFSFTVAAGGATFRFGAVAGADDVTIGLGAVRSSTLGRTSGLGSLRSISAEGGLPILDAAAREVEGLRSRLGTREERLQLASERSLNAALERFAGGSSVEFAEEIVRGVRERLVQESGLVVPGSATLTAGQALRLLI